MLTAEVPERVVLLELDREVAAAFLVGQQGVHRAVEPIGLQRHRLPRDALVIEAIWLQASRLHATLSSRHTVLPKANLHVQVSCWRTWLLTCLCTACSAVLRRRWASSLAARAATASLLCATSCSVLRDRAPSACTSAVAASARQPVASRTSRLAAAPAPALRWDICAHRYDLAAALECLHTLCSGWTCVNSSSCGSWVQHRAKTHCCRAALRDDGPEEADKGHPDASVLDLMQHSRAACPRAASVCAGCARVFLFGARAAVMHEGWRGTDVLHRYAVLWECAADQVVGGLRLVVAQRRSDESHPFGALVAAPHVARGGCDCERCAIAELGSRRPVPLQIGIGGLCRRRRRVILPRLKDQMSSQHRGGEHAVGRVAMLLHTAQMLCTMYAT